MDAAVGRHRAMLAVVGSSRFTEVVEGGLLGLSRPLGPLVAWLLQRQATADLLRLKHLLETQPFSRSVPEEPAT